MFSLSLSSTCVFLSPLSLLFLCHALSPLMLPPFTSLYSPSLFLLVSQAKARIILSFEWKDKKALVGYSCLSHDYISNELHRKVKVALSTPYMFMPWGVRIAVTNTLFAQKHTLLQAPCCCSLLCSFLMNGTQAKDSISVLFCFYYTDYGVCNLQFSLIIVILCTD